MIPDLANDPAVQAAWELNHNRPGQVRFKDKLLFILPIPVGCYLLANGVVLAADSGGDPVAALRNGLVGSLGAMGGFVCFFLALRAYFKIRRLRREA